MADPSLPLLLSLLLKKLGVGEAEDLDYVSDASLRRLGQLLKEVPSNKFFKFLDLTP